MKLYFVLLIEKEDSSDSPAIQKKTIDSKRKKVTGTNGNKIYPVLSDIESTTTIESDQDNYTTATVSSRNERPQYNQQQYRNYEPNSSYEEDDRYFFLNLILDCIMNKSIF